MTPGFIITRSGRSFAVSGRGVAQFDAQLRACLARYATTHPERARYPGLSPVSARRPDALPNSGKADNCNCAGRPGTHPAAVLIGAANAAVARLNAIAERAEGRVS